jgi:hypothetical protein
MPMRGNERREEKRVAYLLYGFLSYIHSPVSPVITAENNYYITVKAKLCSYCNTC